MNNLEDFREKNGFSLIFELPEKSLYIKIFSSRLMSDLCIIKQFNLNKVSLIIVSHIQYFHNVVVTLKASNKLKLY